MPDLPSVENISALARSEHPDDRECAAREAQQHVFNDSIQSILLDLIGDPDWRVRHAAVESICSAGEIKIVPEVISALYDETNAGKRNAALDILTRFGNAILPYVQQHLKTSNSDVRMFLITLLGLLRDRIHLKFIASCLQDPEENVVSAAIVALGSIGDDSFTPQLIHFLHSQNLWLQFQAIEASGEMQDESLLPHLIPLLDSPYCRKASITAIGNFQYPDAYHALATNLIRSDQMDTDVLHALIDLYHAPGPETIRLQDQQAIRNACSAAIGPKQKEILRVQLGSEDRLHQFLASHILAFDSDIEAVQILVSFQSDPQFSELAMRALQSIGYEDAASTIPPSSSAAETPLLQSIKNEDGTVRRKSSGRMAREIREAYCEPLMAALADEDPRVRESAADALEFYPSEKVTEALLATLGDEDPWVRAAIYGSLPLEKIDVLFQRLPKENPIGQAAILRALAKGDLNRVVPVLQTYLNHETPEIRAAACQSLSSFPTNDIISLLKDRFNEDTAWSVRVSALRALAKMTPPQFYSMLYEKLRSESDPLVKKEILSALHQVHQDFFPEIVFDLLKDSELADDAYAYLRSQISRKDSILERAAHCRPSVRRIVRKTLD